jgi:hypothetical protein
MTFPLWYLLVPYIAVVAFAALFLFFNVFHMWRYGIEAGKTWGLISVYVGSFIVLIGFSVLLLLPVDWEKEVSPLELLPLRSGVTSDYGL